MNLLGNFLIASLTPLQSRTKRSTNQTRPSTQENGKVESDCVTKEKHSKLKQETLEFQLNHKEEDIKDFRDTTSKGESETAKVNYKNVIVIEKDKAKDDVEIMKNDDIIGKDNVITTTGEKAIISNNDAIIAKDNITTIDNVSDRTLLIRDPSYCVPCGCYRAVYTHHCYVCHVCVSYVDHHCPFTRCCIGKENYLAFFLFLFYTLSGNLFSIISC
eukprot:Awhi_evm1s9146